MVKPRCSACADLRLFATYWYRFGVSPTRSPIFGFACKDTNFF
ncbi:MAG: hypothetical protein ACI30J_03925 [Paludibacteraceae bacterium]